MEDQDPYSGTCYEDMSGKWEHSPLCFDCMSSFDFYMCDVELYHTLGRQLRSLSLLPMLALAFQNPSLANGQRLLDGLANDERGIYSSRFGNHCFEMGWLLLTLTSDVLRKIQLYKPRIGDVDFAGYKVSEEWEDIRYSGVMPLMATFTLCSFVAFRLVFGDWQTAIGASSLEVAVLGLAIQWAVYVAGKD